MQFTYSCRFCKVYNRIQRLAEVESGRIFIHQEQSIRQQDVLVLCQGWNAQMQSTSRNNGGKWRTAFDCEKLQA